MVSAYERLAAEPRQPRNTKRGRPIAAARVDPALYDRLYALSRLLRVDVSELVREAIETRVKLGLRSTR